MHDYLKRHPKWFLAIKVLPIVAAAFTLKFGLHTLGWEPLSVSPLLTSLIAATVFLLGFLISGTLGDYKESERLPGEMAASLEAIADECRILRDGKNTPEARAALAYLADFSESILKWFEKSERTRVIMAKIEGLNAHFLAFEPLTQANFIVRMKQEQNALRRQVIRIHAIRETSFVSAGYTVAEVTVVLLVFAFTLTEFEPFYESLFLLGLVSFLLVYMLFLIKDLDNPFDHYERNVASSRVSLKPLEDTVARLGERAGK